MIFFLINLLYPSIIGERLQDFQFEKTVVENKEVKLIEGVEDK